MDNVLVQIDKFERNGWRYHSFATLENANSFMLQNPWGYRIKR